MMAAMAPNNIVVRSSMELMLEQLLRKDDNQKPRDLPPALPVRPTSKARLPPSSAARRRPPPPQLGEKFFVSAAGDAEKENRAPAGSPPSFGMKKAAKVPSVEHFESRALRRIIWLQKHFRGRRAHVAYIELKEGAIALQSFIRGERSRNEKDLLFKRWRAAAVIQKHARSWVVRKAFHDRQKSTVLLQSAIRGWLAKRLLTSLRNRKKVSYPESNGDVGNNLQGVEEKSDGQPQLHDSNAELEMRVVKAEAALRQKEEENLTLRQQLKQYEMRWSDNEGKMISMEESWQNQMLSLQTKLAEAKKSLASNILIPLKPDASPIGRYYESEDCTSTDYFHTPDATPAKQIYTASSEGVRTSDSTLSSVSLLVREFEHRKIVFEDDAGFLVEAKARQYGYSLNPDEELKNLKARFAVWKKEFKTKLKETKSALKKLGNTEKKTHRRWWGRKSTSKS